MHDLHNMYQKQNVSSTKMSYNGVVFSVVFANNIKCMLFLEMPVYLTLLEYMTYNVYRIQMSTKISYKVVLFHDTYPMI